jgi:TPR repeat protein
VSIYWFIAFGAAGAALVAWLLSRRLKAMSRADAPPNVEHARAERETEWLYCTGLEALRADEFERAARDLGLAAERGHARAQLYFGLMRELGLGVQADLESARQWYRRAAALGDADAYSRLRMLAEMRAMERSQERIAQTSGAGEDNFAERAEAIRQRVQSDVISP